MCICITSTPLTFRFPNSLEEHWQTPNQFIRLPSPLVSYSILWEIKLIFPWMCGSTYHIPNSCKSIIFPLMGDKFRSFFPITVWIKLLHSNSCNPLPLYPYLIGDKIIFFFESVDKNATFQIPVHDISSVGDNFFSVTLLFNE